MANGFGASTGGFGATPKTGTGLSGFGTPAAGASTGFSSFGAGGGGSGFGTPAVAGVKPASFNIASTAAKPSMGGFGGFGGAGTTTTPAASSTGFGSFGTIGAGSPGTAGAGLFGASKPATSGFGLPTASTGSSFGTSFATNANQAGAPGAFNMSAAQNMNMMQSGVDDPSDQLQEFVDAYNTTSPKCRFQVVFYNKVNWKVPELCQQYEQQRLLRENNIVPANSDSRIWKQAIKENPAPHEFILSHKAGFDALEERITQQKKGLQTCVSEVKVCESTVNEMRRKQDALRSRILDMKKKQQAMVTKLLDVMNVLETERATRGSLALDAQEIVFREKIESMQRKLDMPGSYKSKISDLQSKVARMHGDRMVDPSLCNLNEDSQKNLFKFLQSLQESLAHLTKTLQEDIRTTEIAVKGVQQER